MGEYQKKLYSRTKLFPITLEIDAMTIFNIPELGAHQQFVVRANTFEIARFMEQESAKEYVKFLSESNFKPFNHSEQGRKLLDVLHALYDKTKLIAETKEGDVINREMIKKTIH